jgi:sulfite reductase (ferredoxin)
MIRIKLPFGKVTSEQNGLLRSLMNILQDVYISHTPGYPNPLCSLDRTPELWAQLAIDDITLREACGNTVNITASELGVVDVDEPLTSHLMRMRCFSSS